MTREHAGGVSYKNGRQVNVGRAGCGEDSDPKRHETSEGQAQGLT